MGKNTIKETLAAGLADAPFELIKQIDSYESCTIQVVYDTGANPSTGLLYTSSDYNPEDGTGEWNPLPGSTQAFDITNGGIHTWSIRKIIEPFLKIGFTGDVQAIECVFVGEPKGSRLANI